MVNFLQWHFTVGRQGWRCFLPFPAILGPGLTSAHAGLRLFWGEDEKPSCPLSPEAGAGQAQWAVSCAFLAGSMQFRGRIDSD